MKTNRTFRLSMLMALFLFHQTVKGQLLQCHIGGAGNEVATSVKVMPDGSGTIIAGYNYTLNSSGTAVASSNIIIMKVDPTATVILWQEQLGLANTINLPQSMIITHDNNIVLVGTIGRSSVFGGNIAAIFKFNSATGGLMWQNSLHDAGTTGGGEVFFGVTELGLKGRYNLIAAGAHDFQPNANSGLICAFNPSGGYLYGETWSIPYMSYASTNNYYGICTAPDGINVYLCGIYHGDYSDVRIDEYHPFATSTSGSMIWSNSYDFSLPGIVNGSIGTLDLQDNFFTSIYWSGGKLLLQGGSFHDFTTSAGNGESIFRINDNGTGTGELWQVQNSGLSYANTSKMIVLNSDHVYNVQMPASTWIDPVIWLTGGAANSLVQDIPSLSAITSTTVPTTLSTPVEFLSPSGSGVHSLYDIDLAPSRTNLELAGSTNDPTYGGTDIYFVKTPTSIPRYDCNTNGLGQAVAVNLIPQPSVYNQGPFVPAFVNVSPMSTQYAIDTFCVAPSSPCLVGPAGLTINGVPDGDSCTFTATVTYTLGSGSSFSYIVWNYPLDYPTMASTTTTSSTFTFSFTGWTGIPFSAVLVTVDASGDTCYDTLRHTIGCDGGVPSSKMSGHSSTTKLSSEKDVLAYPNPTNDIVTVSSDNIEINSVEVFDATGRKVACYSYSKKKRVEVPMTKLRPGIYLFRINNSISKVIGKTE